MRSFLFIVSFGLFLGGCDSRSPAPVKAREPSPAELLNVEATKAAELVKAKLKDPDSARFRNVRRVPFMGSRSSHVYCGEVNAKNAMGGYAGFGDFAVSVAIEPDNHQVFIVESNDLPSRVWHDLLCLKDGKPILGKEVTLAS